MSRAYDTSIGRLICPDSLVPVPTNPQSLNRYSYVRNNPMSRIDPTGHYGLRLGSERDRFLSGRRHAGWAFEFDAFHDKQWSLTLRDDTGHTYDLGIRGSYDQSVDSGSLTRSSMAQLASTQDDEWDYVVHTPATGNSGVLVRNNVSNRTWQGGKTEGPLGPRAFVDDLSFGGLRGPSVNAVTYAPDEIWSNDEIRMNSAWLNHELGTVTE